MADQTLPTNHPDALATDLWALLDTEHNPPGVIDHEIAIPLISQWITENAHVISGWYVVMRSEAIRNAFTDHADG